jgi:ATP-dependent DNA ligase
MSRTSTLPKRLQPMLATLTDAPFDDPEWVFEDKYDGFRMIAEIRDGTVALYSRNGKIISQSYMEIAKALEGVRADAVIDGELVAIGKDGVSHFQLLQNALRHEAKRGPAEAAAAAAQEEAESDTTARQADRLQPSPQGQRKKLLRRSRAQRS